MIAAPGGSVVGSPEALLMSLSAAARPGRGP